MCGRFVQTSSPKTLSERMDLPSGSLFDRPRFNVAPTQTIAVIRPGELVALQWGLVPSWSKDGKGFINARAETAADKPAFRTAFRQRRCLIPADGFYEWQARAGRKQPYCIRLSGDRPFAFAGLWELWRGPDGPVESCAILTTDANDLVRPVHNRMPVILPRDCFAQWLDPAASAPDALTPLLRPLPADQMHAYPVGPWVNNARNDDPRCVAAVA